MKKVDQDINRPVMTKWIPETDPGRLRRYGKTNEEMHELGGVLDRCIIQGIDETNPKTGKTNRQEMEEEIADVIAQLEINMEKFKLSGSRILERIELKKSLMAEWEAMFT